METATENKIETPKIYVADLAAYVAGTLHGCWIDANQDAEDIHEEIQEMLTESPEPISEEWAKCAVKNNVESCQLITRNR